MVLSTTTRTSSISSIVNRNQGGGPKKAGFPYIVGRDSWTTIHFRESGTAQFLGNSNGSTMGSLRFTRLPNTRQTRPVGISPSPNAFPRNF
tara:strand:+ start:178 stop:450 length:273 start_codon:yes stop_codon:yes gene_type:complete